MTLTELFVYVVIGLAVPFLLCGLAMLIFGSKVTAPTTKSPRLILEIWGHTCSVPYSASIVACVVGIILLLFAFNVITRGGVPPSQVGSLGMSAAYAQTPPREPSFPTGWAYFGPEDRPTLWNFEILGGNYREFSARKPGVVLKALRDVNIRRDHFGSFSGTVLGFLSPAPPVIGTMRAGTCAAAEQIASVGFSKIWVKAKSVPCPH